MTSGTCLLVLGGEIKDTVLFRQRLEEADLVLAADSGARHMLRAGVFPDRVYGDMDSLSAGEIGLLEKGGCRFVVSPAEKDDTDGGIVLKEALDRGFKDIRIWGALGGRPDHAYANIMLLQLALMPAGDVADGGVADGDAPTGDGADSDVTDNDVPTSDMPTGDARSGDAPTGDVADGDAPNVVIEDGGVRIFLAKQGQWIEGKRGSYLSIFALSPEVTGFTQTGLKYQPAGGRYASRFPLGVSNAFLEEKVCLNWEKGIILCMQIEA